MIYLKNKTKLLCSAKLTKKILYRGLSSIKYWDGKSRVKRLIEGRSLKTNIAKLVGCVCLVFSSVVVTQAVFFNDSGQRLDGAYGTTYSIGLADVDDDGDVDAVYGNSTTAQSQVFTNDGSGNYALYSYLPGGAIHTRDIAMADIDNDSDIDIIAASLLSLRIMTNDGNGYYGLYQTIGASGTIVCVSAADFNNDGYVDFVEGISNGNDVVYLNDNNGNFYIGDNTFDYNPYNAKDNFTYDYDMDGIVDIVSLYEYALVFYKGEGDGTFYEKQNFTSLAEMSALDVGDVNNDFSLDIVASELNGVILLFEYDSPNGIFNQSASTFGDASE